MRKLSSIIAALIVAMPACVQAQTYSGTGQGTQGGLFNLVIHREGNRLRFDMTATTGSTSLSGTPVCDRTTVDPTGSFGPGVVGFKPKRAAESYSKVISNSWWPGSRSSTDSGRRSFG